MALALHLPAPAGSGRRPAESRHGFATLLSRRLAAQVLPVVLALAATPLSAQFLTHYKKGIEAVRVEDWDTVSDLMSRAIEERPEERVRLPGRLYRRAYVPHFYLGVARHRLGDCAGALEAWAESERQGVLPNLEESLRVVTRGREACRREDEMRATMALARKALSTTSIAAAALLDLARRDFTRDVWETGDPSPADRHRQGLDLLQKCRERLAVTDPTLADLRQARSFTRQAAELFATLHTDVLQLTEERASVIGASQRGVGELGAEARSVLARTAHLAPYSRPVRRARADLEGLIGEVERRGSEISSEYLAGLEARLRNSIARLEAVARPPSAALASAAEAFILGQYEVVVQTLEAVQLPDRRARAHASLLLAAAGHALFLESGELDRELLDAAAEQVRACHGEDRSVTPTSSVFSPRFVEFFAESLVSESVG